MSPEVQAGQRAAVGDQRQLAERTVNNRMSSGHLWSFPHLVDDAAGWFVRFVGVACNSPSQKGRGNDPVNVWRWTWRHDAPNAVYCRRRAASDHSSRRCPQMADTLVERVTGRPRCPEPVAVNLVMSDQVLLGGDNAPAIVDGYGPIPAAVARGWSAPPSPISGRGPPCAGCTGIPRPGRWWRWNRGRGVFRAV